MDITVISDLQKNGYMFKTRLADSFVGLLRNSLQREGFTLNEIIDLPNWGFRITTDKRTVTMRGSFCVNDVIKKIK